MCQRQATLSNSTYAESQKRAARGFKTIEFEGMTTRIDNLVIEEGEDGEGGPSQVRSL